MSAKWCFLGVFVATSQKKADNSPIDKVSSLIASTLARRGLAQHALASLALHRIDAWLAKRCQPDAARAVRIADHVLTVECSHPIIVQEIQLQLPEMRHFIESECPFASIREIRLTRSSGGPGNALAPENPPA